MHRPQCTHCYSKGFDCNYSLTLKWGKISNSLAAVDANPAVSNTELVRFDRSRDDSPIKFKITTVANFDSHAKAISEQAFWFPIDDVVKSKNEIVPPQDIVVGDARVGFSNQTHNSTVLPVVAISKINSPLNPRWLYDHFLNHTSCIFVCYDDDDNPFRVHLVPMALQPGATQLLAAVLALSAFHYATTRDRRCLPLAYYLMNTAISGFRKVLESPARSEDTTLATALTLCTFECISGNDSHWRTHLDGAKYIIIHGAQHDCWRKSRNRSFLLKWYVQFEVMVAFRTSMPGYNTAITIAELDVMSSKTFEIDKTIGFRLDLLFLIVRIGTIANELASQQQPSSLETYTVWMRSVAEVELNLDRMLRATGPACDLNHKNTALLACNLAFLFTARLLIQRKCLCLRLDEVQDTVGKILGAIKDVPVNIQSETAVVYPLFHAGVVAQGPVLRGFVLDRLSRMQRENAKKALELLRRLWEDEGLGLVNETIDWMLILV